MNVEKARTLRERAGAAASVDSSGEGGSEVVVPITGMTCANCVATVERTLRKTPGVSAASVNYASERATVRFDPRLVSLEGLASAGGSVVVLPFSGSTGCSARWRGERRPMPRWRVFRAPRRGSFRDSQSGDGFVARARRRTRPRPRPR